MIFAKGLPPDKTFYFYNKVIEDKLLKNSNIWVYMYIFFQIRIVQQGEKKHLCEQAQKAMYGAIRIHFMTLFLGGDRLFTVLKVFGFPSLKIHRLPDASKLVP
jgi:hypothetical protein